MLNVWCVWVNDKYSFKYVTKLYDKLCEFTDSSIILYNFYCVIDSPDKYIPYKNINYILIDQKLYGIWYKYYMLTHYNNYINNTFNNIFFDLDSIILKDIDDLLLWAKEYDSANLAVCWSYHSIDIFNKKHHSISLSKYLFCLTDNNWITCFHNSSIMVWSASYMLKYNEPIIESHKSTLRPMFSGFDELLAYEDPNIEHIPIHFYYSLYANDWLLKNLFSVALLNNSQDKIEEKSLSIPWINEYWTTAIGAQK